MRCPSCEPDYCACADFYGGRLKYWKGEMMTDTLPQRIEAAERADRERTPESLTRLERAWLKRRECGWCNALMTARTCQAMFSEPCNMDLRRGRALQDYKPRAALRAKDQTNG